MKRICRVAQNLVCTTLLLTLFLMTSCKKSAISQMETSFTPVVSAYLQEVKNEEDAAKRSPRLFVYRSPIQKENDIRRYVVLWHEIQSHRLTFDPALDWPGAFHGRVWLTARTLRKVGATPEAALSARAEQIGSDTAVLVELWEKGVWRRLTRIDWENKLEEQNSSPEVWESFLDERPR